jgi:hypothetical protein
LECGLELGRRDIADRLQAPRRRISSVLSSPMIVSARALSNELLAGPTEVTAPASVRRSV